MDIEPYPTQHPLTPAASVEEPRDLTWLGMADDRELLHRAREIASNNGSVNQATNGFDGIESKLNCWRLAQG